MAKFTGHTITSDSALGDAKIQRSLRFNSSDAAYLTRTPSSTGNQKVWTWSAWVKRAKLGSSTQYLFASMETNGSGDGIAALYFQSDQIYTYYDTSSSSTYGAVNSRKYRDTSAWMNIVWQVDAANTTHRIWINGVEETGLSNNPINYNYTMNQSGWPNVMGTSPWNTSSAPANMYLAEVNHIDGSLIAPTEFGFTDPVTNIWMPKRYEGTYGTNGFNLDFSDNSSTAALGIDKSPNGNDFTANNFSVSAGVGNDSLEDTPTNNFCTLNPLVGRGGNYLTHTNGNLNFDIQPQSTYPKPVSTFNIPTSGKWYAEWVFTTTGSAVVGVGNVDKAEESGAANQLNGINMLSGDIRVNDSGTQSSLTTFTTNDVIGVKADRDAGTVSFTINGSAVGNPENISSMNTPTDLVFWAYRNASGGDAPVGYVNFGQRPFSYLPTGYKALSSKNLPPNVPSIVRPQKHFDTLLYTGNDSSDRNIEGLEFKPDFVWIKNREGNDWHMLQDSVRGANKVLYSNRTDGEDTDNTNGHINYFMNGGFNVTAGDSGNVNENNEDYVAWCWKAGGNSNTFNVDDVGYASASAAGITEGSISLTGASINTKAGFSIVSYTGNGTAGATIGHGLGVAPNWIFAKVRNASRSWAVGTDFSPWTLNIRLEESSGSADTSQSQSQWYETAPTSSVFYVGDGNTGNYSGDTNVNGENYIAYCWTDIPGYSKFGSYTGNGSSDGTYVHLGFKPAFLMVKKTSGANSWVMFDVKRSTTNVIDNYLIAEGADVDNTNSAVSVDFLSNGVKFRSGYDIVNAGDYIYMAFAEQPGVTPFDTLSNAH